VNPVSGIVVYVILWWVVFFTMLPVGVKTQHEAGLYLAAVLWLGYYWLQGSGLITLRPDFQ
jgi:hypothetical protein